MSSPCQHDHGKQVISRHHPKKYAFFPFPLNVFMALSMLVWKLIWTVSDNCKALRSSWRFCLLTPRTPITQISLFSTTPTSCVKCSALTLCLDIQSREKVVYPNLFYFFLNFLSILKSHTHSLIQMPFNIILMTQWHLYLTSFCTLPFLPIGRIPEWTW